MVDRSPGFFDVDLRLAELSAKGDDLERVKGLVDFEMFRPALEGAIPRADRSKGGRPAFDHLLMFKVLILQAMHALSDERCEYLIKDRLSFMRFLGLGLSRSCSRRQYDLDLSRSAEANRRRRWPVPAVRRGAAGVGIPGDERADRRCDDRCGAQAAQHDRGEEGDQGRAHSRGVEGQAGQAGPEGSRRPLDGQIHQGQAAGGRERSAGRPRHPGVRLQKPCRDRPRLRSDPQLDDDERRGA